MKTFLPLLLCVMFTTLDQSGITQNLHHDSVFHSSTFSKINFRSIGPAFMSGRIADIAIDPTNDNVWYVAVGSGGVWKTKNAGTTWTPLFDKQSVYSTGCLTIDPNNPHVIWVGTGENVGGRHVGFGDGIYRSDDGGTTWKNMGLKESQHLSEIIIHPSNSDIIWVAAQGPLWNRGGQRGFYKSIDGGKTWKRTLGNYEWTGVTDIMIDPRNPDVLYAATWDRHRTVAAYMGGGPGSGLHRSDDGGETWEKLTRGLPTSNLGKIGLAISPQQPDVLYAAIELDRRTGGVYRSANRGSSWTKMSDAISGGTGPHYYQELYASPHVFDRIYLANVRILVSDKGGADFKQLKEEHKHSDNHAMVFKKDDPNYLMIGTDGGIYESFDLAKNWRFINNLPITQYYKVAVDDDLPFYNVYGGTQDNNTQGGPSRTDNVHGIRNDDWHVVLFGDGHQPATEPGNPNIIYSEWQQGNLCRIDMTTGEIVYIKPQPTSSEIQERYNWDAPILVSSHDVKRLYFASQHVWRSDNRGDSWTAISADLSRNQNRIELDIMGRQQSFDNPWDIYAMSNYNTITSLTESPINADKLFVGTDDGLIQITNDGGKTWSKTEASVLSGVPSTAFINDIKADLFDENSAYVAMDNHKFGDFAPYLLKTNDNGKTWKSIANNLPERLLIWRIVQDHIDKNLFFVATEFGIYFSINSGEHWTKFTGSLPTISFRDLAIQRRENDLVAASFGRSFYILDDYSFLRELNEETVNKEAALFNTRDALWYIPRPGVGFDAKGNQGASYYTAANPDFGAVFTYYLKESIESASAVRKKNEKELNKKDENIPFPGWNVLQKELEEEKSKLWIIIRDENDQVIRRLIGETSKGFHRIAWDLKYPDYQVVKRDEKFNPKSSGLLAGPGQYTVQLALQEGSEYRTLTGKKEFKVIRMREGVLSGSTIEVTTVFWREIEDLQLKNSSTKKQLTNSLQRINALRSALYKSSANPGPIDQEITFTRIKLLKLKARVSGNKAKSSVGEKNKPSIDQRLSFVFTGTQRSTYGPTPSQIASIKIVSSELTSVLSELNSLLSNDFPAIEASLREAGANWIEGQDLPKFE